MVGQLLLLQGEPLFFADCSQEKGKQSHCSWPLTNRKRFGFCQACANRQKCHFPAAGGPTALLERPFVVTREHSEQLVSFAYVPYFGLLWNLLTITLLCQTRCSLKIDPLLKETLCSLSPKIFHGPLEIGAAQKNTAILTLLRGDYTLVVQGQYHSFS